jgi:hypothetical protein
LIWRVDWSASWAFGASLFLIWRREIAMAPKEKRNYAWNHCQVVEGGMVCNHCHKEIVWGVHMLKQHLACVMGNIKPCLRVSLELIVEMQDSIEGYKANKAKNKQMQKERGRSGSVHDSEN